VNESLMDMMFKEEDFLIDEEEPRGIVRRKKFALRPMNEQEAVLQMDLLEHNDFFVFFNAETNSVNVLYSRRDGTLGLIETDV
jgi:putative sigma-54 modulation protein